MHTETARVQVDDAIKRFPDLLRGSLLALKQMDRACHCKDALRRYKDKGMIGEDWRTWI